MECPQCSWNILFIGIIVNTFLALFIAFLFKFIIVPKIEKKYERNEFNVHIGIMGYVNSFDQTFKFFYETFERYMGNIRDLNNGEWLPRPYQETTTNETGGMEIHIKPEPERSRILNTMKKFKELNEDLLKNDEEKLINSAKTVFKYIEKNENYIDPALRWNINNYITLTIFYVQWLRKEWNYTEQLFKRLERAKEIIRLLKKEQSFSDKFTRFWKRKKIEDISHIGEFIKKWQDYEESENNPN